MWHTEHILEKQISMNIIFSSVDITLQLRFNFLAPEGLNQFQERCVIEMTKYEIRWKNDLLFTSNIL